jgi:hypothetical protein
MVGGGGGPGGKDIEGGMSIRGVKSEIEREEGKGKGRMIRVLFTCTSALMRRIDRKEVMGYR